MRLVVDTFRKMEQELIRSEEDFLRAQGWRLAQDTPGGMVLWEKRLEDGRTVMVNRTTAILVEHAIADNANIEEGETAKL